MSISTVGQGSNPDLQAPPPMGFGVAAGTPVLTMEGVFPVEYLTPGDRLITRSGAVQLRGVSVAVLDAPMVRISHDILGQGRPSTDLLLHPDQPVLIRDARARLFHGVPRAMVAARRLVDGEFIRLEGAQPTRLFTLHLAAEAVIYAGGLELGCPAPVAA